LIIDFLKKIKILNKYYKYIFFSENINYLNSYKDFLLLLAKKNNDSKILHLVSDNEETYKSLIMEKNIITVGIGGGTLRTLTFLLIRGKYFFMTLTNLGNYYLKKSTSCKNYIYFFHSLASINKVYEHNAFKNYDIVCCNGDYHYQEILEQEKRYAFPKKKLIKSGFIYLDYLKKNINLNKMIKKTILFAPSWNEAKENLLEKYGYEIIKHLISRGYKVIFRPHPEHFKRSKLAIQKILNHFEKKENFYLSKNLSDLASLEKSNLLITDYSGIALEFLSILHRPVLLIEVGNKRFNKDFDSSHVLFEDKFKEKFAIKVSCKPLDLDNLSDIIDKEINGNKMKNQIEEFLKLNLYNYGSVSEKLINNFQ